MISSINCYVLISPSPGAGNLLVDSFIEYCMYAQRTRVGVPEAELWMD